MRNRSTEGAVVANTPLIGIRVPPELTARARARVGEPDIDLAVLVRAGLTLLANAADAADGAIREALASARTRPGPKPRGRASA
jgi:hypothetical protein